MREKRSVTSRSMTSSMTTQAVPTTGVMMKSVQPVLSVYLWTGWRLPVLAAEDTFHVVGVAALVANAGFSGGSNFRVVL